MTVVETKNELEVIITKDTAYLALMGELWGAFCEDCGGNRPDYNGTILYHGYVVLCYIMVVFCYVVCPFWNHGLYSPMGFRAASLPASGAAFLVFLTAMNMYQHCVYSGCMCVLHMYAGELAHVCVYMYVYVYDIKSFVSSNDKTVTKSRPDIS